MLEFLLIAAAGVAGYLFGRHTAPAVKDHTAMILLMAGADRRQRKAILDIPAVPWQNLPGPAAELRTMVPPVPLFTDDEKRAVLREVSEKQQELIKGGVRLTPEQLVTPDELELKPPPAPPARPGMAGMRAIPIRYIFS